MKPKIGSLLSGVAAFDEADVGTCVSGFLGELGGGIPVYQDPTYWRKLPSGGWEERFKQGNHLNGAVGAKNLAFGRVVIEDPTAIKAVDFVQADFLEARSRLE